MKKNIAGWAIVLLLCVSVSSNGQVVKGSGTLKSEVRDVKGYNKLVANGLFQLFIIQGEDEGVRIETDNNIVELFQTHIEGQTLYVTMTADIRRSEALNVYVSIKQLKQIVLLNEVTLKTDNVIHFDELKLASSGLSKIDAEIFASKLHLEITDGTVAYVKGYTEKLEVEIHDDAELNAFDLQSDYCVTTASGFAEVMVNAQKDLQLKVTGASNLYYTGDAKVSERIFSSTGFIVKRKRNNAASGN